MNTNDHSPSLMQKLDECRNTQSQQLNLFDLHLTEIPKELSEFTWLTYLKLSFNQITKIEGLENLINLTELYLDNNKITKIEGLGDLTRLKELHFENNQISKIENLENLNKINLLYLNANQIIKIENLEKLNNLEFLHLYNNRISKIEGLENLSQIMELILSFNQISKIEGLENLINVSKLLFYENRISKIEGLKNLSSLTELHLSNNPIIQIEGLDNLINLSILNLSGCLTITKIEGLDSLLKLSFLDISYNQITKLEGFSISQLDKMEQIRLSNNPIEELPQNSLDNVKAILGYVKYKMSNNKVPNLHLKLNIIGEGRIGKSQLFNIFNGKGYIINQKKTHGTNTTKYAIPNQTYEALIWDFGGQSYHNGFHQIFIRPTDFNVVMWSNKNPLKREYSFWLGTARNYSPESPIFLVQNVWKENDCSDNSVFIPHEIIYPDSEKLNLYNIQLQSVFSIDLKSYNTENDYWKIQNDYFFQSLHFAMIEHIKKNEKFKEIPQRWLDIRNELDKNPFKNQEIFLLKSDFKNRYAQDFNNISDFEILLVYLEFSGSILYFYNIVELKEYIFLNPPKLSDWLFQTILDEDFKTNKNGILEFNKLVEREDIGKEKADIFLKIMQAFKLIFEEKNSKNRFVIPQFLPKKNNIFKRYLLEIIPITFCIRFTDYFHEGRIFQFISEYGEYAEDNRSYWNCGIIFTKSRIKGLVYYEKKERIIFVHIDDKKGSLQIAEEIFDFFIIEENKIQTVIDFAKDNQISAQELINTLNFFGLKVKTSTIISDEMADYIKNNLIMRTKMAAWTVPINIDIDNYQKEIIQKKLILIFNKRMKLKVEYILNGIQLSTNGINFLDIKETIKNISAKNYFGFCQKTQNRIKLDLMAINLLSDNNKRKLRIFLSYSHKDESYRIDLERHLAMLKRTGRIETWYDRKIIAGEIWDNKIKEQLQVADIVLLMISSYFLDSEYIWNEELGILRHRIEKNDGVKIIPIFVQPCDMTGFDMLKFQGAQKDNQSVLPFLSSCGEAEIDQVYTDISKNIREAIDKME